MSESVKVPYGKGGDNAVLLLDAAEKLDLEPGVVRTTTYGFEVPEEVAKKAGLDPEDPDEAFNAEIEEARKESDAPSDPPGSDMTLSRSGYDEQEANSAEAPAKKTAAKKTTAKKATAKKAAAKKSTNKES